MSRKRYSREVKKTLTKLGVDNPNKSKVLLEKRVLSFKRSDYKDS
jgi:hypothetical protein